jgi:hypothetical protein
LLRFAFLAGEFTHNVDGPIPTDERPTEIWQAVIDKLLQGEAVDLPGKV